MEKIEFFNKKQSVFKKNSLQLKKINSEFFIELF
jgi:hypothetical protein